MSPTSYHCSTPRCGTKVQKNHRCKSPFPELLICYLREVHHLGHAFLAVAPAEFRFGAIIADGVRGGRERYLPLPMRAGVAFHREVDYRTDRHPAFRRARERLRPTMGRYAGIFVDLWLDATLGENWATLSSESLSTFLQELRSTIHTYQSYGPPSWQGFFKAATETDLLYRFASYEGMCRHIETFIERRRLPISPREATATLCALQGELEPILLHFWKDAITWRKTYTPL